MYDDIVLFIHIVQHRGLAAAAQQLGIPAATMTRKLQKLERSLGCQLVHRSARQFVLTPEGEAHYLAYANLVEQLELTQRSLRADMHEMSGKLKVLAPTGISIGLLQPMWSRFIKTYPDIQLEISLNNVIEDMALSKADLALRVGPQQNSALYQKHLGTLQTVLVATSGYLKNKGEPESLDALKGHHLIATKAVSIWNLVNSKTGQQYEYRPRVSTLSNDVSLITQLACDGIGIALLPMSEVKSHIESGQLKRVLPEWRGPDRDLFAVWPTGRLLNAKARCLRDFIHDYLREHL
ncbi:LysR family transcriptional regulator [Neptunomonas antarctica]|uniref:LysR family transcriptional regulator, transcriptional activator AphB n=1 Tax=Neptunomonas antarctica TaxID=619304 RepID=A0A1N7KGS6_9GAMM|nr:LysR family transcriptional regulator [Neptunomonas antarctica]SIS60785.1 LysR family transcriptional regulator, transcriptional activator AphB [Neptunomonas antarctica]